MSAKAYIIGAVIVVIVALLLFGLYDNRTGNDTIGEQLRRAGQAQQSITTGIDESRRTVTELKGEIDRSGETVDRIKGNVRDAGEVIRDCKSILKAVRERNKVTDPQG